MKQIIKFTFMAFAVALAITACAPQEFDNYSLGDSYTITSDQFSFDMTPGSDEYNYSFKVKFSVDPAKKPFSYEIRFGDGQTVKHDLKNGLEYTVSHEYIVLKGTYTAQCLVYNPNGDVIIKDKKIVITTDNDKLFIDDPASLQFALTGGKANTSGKQWRIGAWSAMRNPDNRGEVWWDFKNDAVMNDLLTFFPNSINPNGKFSYDNKGDTHMNESLGDLFPDGNTAGSFVTTHYTPPKDASWSIAEKGGKKYLTINKGFITYATAPADLEKTEYEVLSYTPSSVRLVLSSGWNGWCFELSTEAPSDPLTGTGSKTWVVDSNNKHLKEVKDALPEIAGKLKGHMGLGPINGGYQDWWAAGPGEKATAFPKLYSTTYKFTSGGQLTITTGGQGYGRKKYDGQAYTSTALDGDDMLFPYDGGTYTFTKAGGQLTISGTGYLVYYCGEQTYDIVYLSDTALCVRVKNAGEGQDWVFILCPQGEQ